MSLQIFNLPHGKLYVNNGGISESVIIRGNNYVIQPHKVKLLSANNSFSVELPIYFFAPSLWDAYERMLELLKKKEVVKLLIDVFKADRLGDQIILTVIAAAYKETYGEKVEITILTNEQFFRVWKNNSNISSIVSENDGSYDLVVDMNNIDMKCVPKRDEVLGRQNRTQLVLEQLGLRLSDKTPIYNVSSEERIWATKELISEKRPYIGVALKSHALSRTYSHMLRVIEILKNRNFSVIVLDEMNDDGNFKYTYSEMMALIERCAVIITADSAVLHAAGALRKRIVGIFGYTLGIIMCDSYERAVWIQGSCPKDGKNCWWDLSCIKGKNYQEKENKAEVECLKNIKPEEIIKTFEKQLAEVKKDTIDGLAKKFNVNARFFSDPENYFARSNFEYLLTTGKKFSFCIIRDNSSYITRAGVIGGRGDVLMASVVAKALKMNYGKQIEVFMKVMNGGEQLLKYNPYIDKVFVDEKEMKNIKSDVTFLANDLEFKLEMEKIEIGEKPSVGRPELYMKQFGLELVNKAPVYIVSEEESIWAKGELKRCGYILNDKIIAIQIKGSNISRTWTRVDELVSELKKDGFQILYLDEMRNEDQELFKYTLRQSAALMKYAKLVVTPNSFYFHLAGAMRHRCITLFGSVDSDVWVQDYEKVLPIEVKCSYNKNKCWWKLSCLVGQNMQAKELSRSPECLTNITLEHIYSAIEKHYAAKKIAVMLLTFDCIESTKKTIDSIRSFHDYEIFVVDNASTDGTQDWFEKQGIKIISKKMSVTQAQNAGLRMIFESGEYDYIVILNNDVVLAKNYIDTLVETIERRKCAAVTGRVFEAPEFNMYNFSAVSVDAEKAITSMAAGDLSAILFRTEAIRSVGAFDERFFPRYQEDEDIILRIRLLGYEIIKTMKSGFFHVLGTTQAEHLEEKKKHTENWDRNVEKFKQKWGFDPYSQRNTVDNLENVKRLCKDWRNKIHIPLFKEKSCGIS